MAYITFLEDSFSAWKKRFKKRSESGLNCRRKIVPIGHVLGKGLSKTPALTQNIFIQVALHSTSLSMVSYKRPVFDGGRRQISHLPLEQGLDVQGPAISRTQEKLRGR